MRRGGPIGSNPGHDPSAGWLTRSRRGVTMHTRASRTAGLLLALLPVLIGCSATVAGRPQIGPAAGQTSSGALRSDSSSTHRTASATPSRTTIAHPTMPPSVSSSSPTVGPTPNPAAVYIGRCFAPGDQLQIEPSSVPYGCDGTGTLINMHWTSWAQQGANGAGSTSLNDCNPTCAEGKEHYYSVVVHLGGAQPVPSVAACTNSAEFYATLIIAFPNGWPAALFGGPAPTTYRGMGAESYDALPNATC